VHSVRDIRQIEIHIAEPLVCGHSPSEVKIAVVKLEKYKLPGSDQIPAKLIEAGSETLLRFTNPLILYGRRKSLLLYQFTERVIKLTIIVMPCHCYQLHTKLYPIFSVKSIHR
jgi:hypothetical protein